MLKLLGFRFKNKRLNEIDNFIKNNKSLKSLDLSESEFTEEAFHLLMTSLKENSSLETLILTNCKLNTFNVLQNYGKFFTEFSSLTHLDLSDNKKITKGQGKDLKPINIKLRFLHLNNIFIDEDDAMHFASSIKRERPSAEKIKKGFILATKQTEILKDIIKCEDKDSILLKLWNYDTWEFIPDIPLWFLVESDIKDIALDQFIKASRDCLEEVDLMIKKIFKKLNLTFSLEDMKEERVEEMLDYGIKQRLKNKISWFNKYRFDK